MLCLFVRLLKGVISMLTVSTALKLEQFKGAKLVAGHRGAQNVINWVHIVGVPDAAQWLNGGELVLTTAINIPEGEEAQRAYLRALGEKGVSALALAVGRYLPEIPAYMREQADECGLPLIEIPYEARFVDVAKTTNEQITQENMVMVQRALSINSELTQLVLDGGDLKQLASTLADLIGHSISIENERFEALASANISPVDEARRYTLLEGRTNPHLVQALHDRGILQQIQETRRPVFIPRIPEVGLEMERILAPIVVHGDIYGYAWVIADKRPLSALDQMALESAATIAALMMLYQEAVQSAEASLKGSLLAQLIDGTGGRDAVLMDQSMRFGVDLNQPFYLLVLEMSSRKSSELLQMYRRVHRLVTVYEWALVAGQFAGQIVLLAQADNAIESISERIHNHANGQALRIGVSGEHHSASQVALAYQQAIEALFIYQRLGMKDRTAYFDQLGYLHALYYAGAESLKHNALAPRVRKLLDEQQADLFHTLEVYLDCGSNGVQTAKRLHIHRSTLNYRLERIRELCACDLSDPQTCTNLQITLKLLRLFALNITG